MTWNRNANDLFAGKWLRAPATTESALHTPIARITAKGPGVRTSGSLEKWVVCMCHDLRVTHRSDDVAAGMPSLGASTGPNAPRPPCAGVMLPGPFLINGFSPARKFSTIIPTRTS